MNTQTAPHQPRTRMHRVPTMMPVLLALLLTGAAWAAAAEPALTAEQEATARQVEEQLMAPCCFGSTVATHHSPTADAIRQQVRSMVVDGASAQQILDKYLDVYGERILAQPVARGFNLLAYWMPVVGMLFGTAIVLLWLHRRRRTVAAESPVTPPADEPDDATRRLRLRLAQELAAFDA
jgi:cytochrome c-type biogenesis protein CcmH